MAALVLVRAAPDPIMAQASFKEEAGTLPDGTAYRMRVPPNWNRVLISDLDYANARVADNERNMYLLERGYAMSGTARHPRREFEYDPAQEVSRLVKVLDMFEAHFGKPMRVIQYGHSGGGHIALAMSEIRPDRIDGAIAGCGHTPVWLMNTMLDGWFVLKALVAPELAITDLPEDHKAITAAWRKAFEAAQQTPAGRARIALAVTIGQWPAWVSDKTPKPDPKDVAALQKSMYETIVEASGEPGGQSRFMFEQSAGQLSSNTGVDYRKFFDNGNESYKKAVRALYSEADLDLKADLDRINAFPRIPAKASALDFWSSVPGRTINGMPRVPVLRIHTIGDLAVPISLIQGYETRVHENGRDNWFRTGIVDRPGHCSFSTAESAAAIETLMRRIDTGNWGNSTDPEQLNKLGNSLNKGDSRFIRFEQQKYNRTWFPKTSTAAPGSRTN
jgi:pimeloyl-ACP methyl ester carboxylesterase